MKFFSFDVSRGGDVVSVARFEMRKWRLNFLQSIDKLRFGGACQGFAGRPAVEALVDECLRALRICGCSSRISRFVSRARINRIVAPIGPC